MKNISVRILSIIFVIMILAASLASCGNSSYSERAYSANGYAEDSYDEGNAYDSGSSDADTKTDQKSVKGELTEDKLVYTCDIQIETTDYKTTMDDINGKIKTYKGIIESKTERDSDSYWYYSDNSKTSGTMTCTITVKIPAADYNKFLDEVGESGKVTSKSMNVENISSQYHDVEARISALEIQQERLLEMLKQAESIDDMLTIEARLTDVETELNQYKTTKSSMDLQTAYSTITIDVDEVVEYSKDGDIVKTNTFWDRLGNTLKDAWRDFLNILECLLFFIIRALPVLIVLGVIALIVILIVKKAVKSSKKKQQEQKKFTPYMNYQNQNTANRNFTPPVQPDQITNTDKKPESENESKSESETKE